MLLSEKDIADLKQFSGVIKAVMESPELVELVDTFTGFVGRLRAGLISAGFTHEQAFALILETIKQRSK